MTEAEASLTSDTDDIRLRFETVLRNNIRRLMDAMPEAASLPFDIVTITSLILLVERENEIQTFPESAPLRYSEKTLIDDLSETGIDMDAGSRKSVGNLSTMGFVTINQDHELIPRDSTPGLVAVLDNLFPGMPGMNLVAYFLQTLQEAVSGRKDVEQAIHQFEQTLLTRGVSLSKLKESAGLNGKPDAPPKQPNAMPKASEVEVERRDVNMQRLRELRSQKSGYESHILGSASAIPLQKMEVKSLFPPAGSASVRAEDPTDPMDEHSDTSDSETAVTGSDAGPAGNPDRDPTPEASAEMLPADANEPPQESDVIDTEADQMVAPASDVSIDPVEEQRFPVNSDGSDDNGGFEAPAAVPEEGTASEASVAAADISVQQEGSVDEKIEAFQNYLAMTCPYCREGKVLAAETEKGKIYYSCENPECNFISWGKPYHFSCPYCRNPFLVEFNTQDGINGLKCPKATCNFRQDHLESPLLKPATPSPLVNTEAPKKKRKKLVRKRLVRRKR